MHIHPPVNIKNTPYRCCLSGHEVPRWQDGSLQNCNIDMFTAQHGGLTVNPRPMALFKHNEVCFCPWILNFETSSLSPSLQKRQNTPEKYLHIGYPRRDIPLNLPKNHQDQNLWCLRFLRFGPGFTWFDFFYLFPNHQFLKAHQPTNPRLPRRSVPNLGVSNWLAHLEMRKSTHFLYGFMYNMYKFYSFLP